MEFNRQNIKTKVTSTETHVIDEGLRAYMLKVYNYMASGIFLTGIISLLLFKLSVVMASDGSITGLTEIGNALYNSSLMWIVMLAPLGVVMRSFAQLFLADKGKALVGMLFLPFHSEFLRHSLSR